MISFRQKFIQKNLIPDAITYLKKKGIHPNLIKLQDANSVSQVNSKSMVLRNYYRNEYGKYVVEIQDKALYRWTKKMVEEIFGMKITNIDEKNRIIKAETENEGVSLDFIELLGLKYKLSIVQND